MREHFTVKRIVAFSIASIPPILAMLLGLFLLVADAIFNLSFAINHIVIPFITIGILALLIFSNKKIFVNVVITILALVASAATVLLLSLGAEIALLIIPIILPFLYLFRLQRIRKILTTLFLLISFTVAFFFCLLLGPYEMLNHNEDDKIDETYYVDVCEAFVSMPTLEEVGNYTKVEHYDYFSSFFGIFTCDADTLIVHYDSTEYQEQKALLENKYIFQADKFYDYYEKECESSCTIADYYIRALSVDGEYDYLDYPKKLMFIATNDSNNTIAYIAFYDDDIDYIESLEEFLLNDCGWKYILKKQQ